MAVIGGRAHNLEQIEAVGKLGYPFAEIDFYDSGTITAQRGELESLAAKYDLTYLAHYPNEGSPRNPEDLNTKFVPKMKTLIDLSADMGIEKGTMHFWVDRRWAPENLLQAKTETHTQRPTNIRQTANVIAAEQPPCGARARATRRCRSGR